MVVHVNNYYVQDNKVYFRKGSKSLLVGTPEDTLEISLGYIKLKDEVYAGKTVQEFNNLLTTLNNLKELVNREVSRRDNMYHAFLYKVETQDVTEVELKTVTTALATQEELTEVLQTEYNNQGKLYNLIQQEYQVAFATNKKLDWFFNTEDVLNIINYHQKVFKN